MFAPGKDQGFVPALPGIDRKTLVWGERTLATEFRMKAGSQLPIHSHPHEQTGYLVSGKIRLTIGADRFEAGPGASWCVPPDVGHGAEILEDTVAIEIFAPVRADYLPGAAKSE
jgi:quercetin dioxygenase-like cupin family protein